MALKTDGLYATWPIGSEVRADGEKIAKAGTDYSNLINDEQGTWDAVEGYFFQPADQVETVKSAYDDLIVHGLVVANATGEIRDALTAYGDTVDELQSDRRHITGRVIDYNQSVRNCEVIPDSGPLSEASIQAEIDRVVNALQTAKDSCAKAIAEIQASVDTQILNGPVPAAVQFAAGEGLDALDFTSVSYTTFTSVETLQNRNWANRIRNTQISFDRAGGFPWIEADRPAGSTSRTTHHAPTAGTRTQSNYIMPMPAWWMTKIPGRVGRFYQSRVGDGYSLKGNTTVEVDKSPWWSKDPSKTTTTTTTQHRTDAIDNAGGRWATAGRFLSKAGFVGDIVGFGFTVHDENAQALNEVHTDPHYAHLTVEEKQAEVVQRRNVAVASNTTIDLGIAGGAALAGAAIGGPAGAAVGFAGGLAVSAFMDWEVFDGRSAKDVVSDKVNDAVDWGQKKWKDWFG